LFGGLGGEALYIDTCGGLVADRLADIVSATVQHCHYMAREETQQGKIKIVVFPGFIFLYSLSNYCKGRNSSG